VTGEQLDALLSALSGEGFGLPYMARSRDYVDPVSTGEARAAELRELHAADEAAHAENVAALSRALEAVA
jgi:hypothetical protein